MLQVISSLGPRKVSGNVCADDTEDHFTFDEAPFPHRDVGTFWTSMCYVLSGTRSTALKT